MIGYILHGDCLARATSVRPWHVKSTGVDDCAKFLRIQTSVAFLDIFSKISFTTVTTYGGFICKIRV